MQVQFACTDEETDAMPVRYQLKSFSDSWVAGGHTCNCGLQTPVEGRCGRLQEERMAEGMGGNTRIIFYDDYDF